MASLRLISIAALPGPASPEAIGVVVVFGVLLSTFLSLFVVPAFYLLLARFTRAPEERTRRLESLEAKVASVDSSHGG